MYLIKFLPTANECYVFVLQNIFKCASTPSCFHMLSAKAALFNFRTQPQKKRESVWNRLILLRQCGNSSQTVVDDSETSIKAHRR